MQIETNNHHDDIVCVRITHTHVVSSQHDAAPSPATLPPRAVIGPFSSLPWPGRAEPREQKRNATACGLREWLRLRRQFRPEELARCICFWNDEDGEQAVCLAE
jgi:hypothetical protein